MDIFFGTVIRSAPVERGGKLIKLDWNKKKVICRRTMYPREPEILWDPNPRGNTRGCRGIEIVNDEIIAASYHSLNVFNLNLEFKRRVSNGLMVGLHEIHSEEESTIWVTSTAIDAALKCNIETGEIIQAYFPRERWSFQNEFNLKAMDIDKKKDNRLNFLKSDEFRKKHSHLHLNTIAIWNDDLYALFNKFGAIVNLTKGTVLIEDSTLVRGHNLVFVDDNKCIVNGSFDHTVNIYDVNKADLIRQIHIPQLLGEDFDDLDLDENRNRSSRIRYYLKILRQKIMDSRLAEGMMRPYFGRILHYIREARKRKENLLPTYAAAPCFVRGLDYIRGSLFVGISPATILQIDYETGELIDFFKYADDIRIAIHGLKVKD